jgi:Flp pilus assembly protein TadG
MLSRPFPLARLCRRAAADREGLAAIEFALIAPFMILLYFGLAELSSAIIAGRHANHATAALGDLVSQCSNVNDSDLTNMFGAASDIMQPLALTSLVQTVSSVTNNNGSSQVQWSRRYTASTTSVGAGVPINTTVQVPANVLNNNGDTVVMTETLYTFKFPFSPAGTALPGPGGGISLDFMRGLSFDDVSYYKPRKSALVTYTGATGSGGNNTQTSCYSS